jgi:DNA-binding Lrp family transcriptional regulator
MPMKSTMRLALVVAPAVADSRSSFPEYRANEKPANRSIRHDLWSKRHIFLAIRLILLFQSNRDHRTMDDTDRRLIALLRDDARASVASLAKLLGVARGTVQNRMARLEADGTIVGYTIRLKPQVQEHRIRALMTIAVEGNRIDAVLKALRGDPAVGELHSTNGRWDIVAELRAENLEAFDRVLARIRQLDGIAKTETSLLLTRFKL